MAIFSTQRSNGGPTRATIHFSQKNQSSPTEPLITKTNKEEKKKGGREGS